MSITQFFINTAYDSTERFDMARLVGFTDNYDPLTSTFLNELRDLPAKGVYTVVDEEGRPDLLSYRIYGTTQFWWVLLYFNGLDNTDALVNGLTVKYPAVTSLEEKYFGLKARQAAAAKAR